MKLFLFNTSLELGAMAQDAGIDYLIVDWERKGKEERQVGKGLEINQDTPTDVYRLSSELSIPITVRINPIGDYSKDEVACAIDNGAKVIMLPMAKTIEEISRFLEIIDNRTETLVQIETPDLVNKTKELSKLAWDYAHVGLNDLMLAKGTSSIWISLVDGTVEDVCNNLNGRQYGFGGMTIIGGGHPIPFNLVLHEMTRLNCSLGILRRSFKRELMGRDINLEIKALRNYIDCSILRNNYAIEEDKNKLHEAVRGIL
jgi:hypothetical protein